MHRRFLVLLVILPFISRAQSRAQTKDPTDSAAVRLSAIDSAVAANPNIYSLLIAKDSKLLKASYYHHFSADSLFNDQSLTKDICSLLIGIAIEKKLIRSVDEKIVDFFPELKKDPDPRKQQVTIRQVMNQASGLYHEDLTRLDLFLKDPDPSGLVLRSPMVADPGKEWHYNNATTHLLSVILTRAAHLDTRAFAEKYLFKPLGITHFDWAKMNDGYYDGSGLLSIRLRSRDMLKIGQLLLDGGQYAQQQIVPAAWVRAILHPDSTYKATWGFENSAYALCWYHITYRGVAITYGMGWGGQFLVIIPAMRSLIVINENTADANAIRQSNYFIHRLFPMIFELMGSGGVFFGDL
jgi:CubicO group peptidase (beta-lactamase class C family)